MISTGGNDGALFKNLMYGVEILRKSECLDLCAWLVVLFVFMRSAKEKDFMSEIYRNPVNDVDARAGRNEIAEVICDALEGSISICHIQKKYFRPYDRYKYNTCRPQVEPFNN